MPVARNMWKARRRFIATFSRHFPAVRIRAQGSATGYCSVALLAWTEVNAPDKFKQLAKKMARAGL